MVVLIDFLSFLANEFSERYSLGHANNNGIRTFAAPYECVDHAIMGTNPDGCLVFVLQNNVIRRICACADVMANSPCVDVYNIYNIPNESVTVFETSVRNLNDEELNVENKKEINDMMISVIDNCYICPAGHNILDNPDNDNVYPHNPDRRRRHCTVSGGKKQKSKKYRKTKKYRKSKKHNRR
jgi:hypothetical protein